MHKNFKKLQYITFSLGFNFRCIERERLKKFDNGGGVWIKVNRRNFGRGEII